MARIFISYASPDRAFSLRLARCIEDLGHTIWIDVLAIDFGNSIPAQIAKGLDAADFLIVVLSSKTSASGWVEEEWSAKYWAEVSERRGLILPVLLEECSIPALLRSRRYIDFRQGFELGLAQLKRALEPSAPMEQLLHRARAAIQPVYEEQTDPSAACSTCLQYSYTFGIVQGMVQLSDINVELAVPYFGKIAGTWKPDDQEKRAAWEMYIELVTRVTAVEIDDEGLLRESLSSLYSLFDITRDILRRYGPAVAQPKAGGSLSFGHIAVNILNLVLRPVLTKWHPLLLDYEHSRDHATSPLEHERHWEREVELRAELRKVQRTLVDYTALLAHVAGIGPVPPMASS